MFIIYMNIENLRHGTFQQLCNVAAIYLKCYDIAAILLKCSVLYEIKLLHRMFRKHICYHVNRLIKQQLDRSVFLRTSGDSTTLCDTWCSNCGYV